MKRANVLGAALVVIGGVAGAAPAGAQVTIGADLGVFSDYVWRGITYTNKFVLQPDAYVTIPAGNASITVGGWGNVEPGAYEDDISENGTEGAGLTEFDWWGEVGVPVGEKTTLTGGITGYVFPNDEGFTSDANTVEIYGKAAFDVPLSPKVSLYYDVDKIKGAYFEGSIAHTIQPKEQKFSVVLGALAGFSAGQGVPDAQALLDGESFNFADDGFTHLDLSAGVPFSAGPFSFSPALHVVVTGDDATKFDGFEDNGDLNDKGVKFWFGTTISWSKALGEVPEEEAEE